MQNTIEKTLWYSVLPLKDKKCKKQGGWVSKTLFVLSFFNLSIKPIQHYSVLFISSKDTLTGISCCCRILSNKITRSSLS